MATKKEIEQHLKIALKDVGKIKPWFDEEVNSYVFQHPSYPVEYAGESKEEVIKNYPKYLREFIRQRLNDRLHPLMEKETKGHGGKRSGAGRPKGRNKPTTKTMRIPVDMVHQVERLIARGRY